MDSFPNPDRHSSYVATWSHYTSSKQYIVIWFTLWLFNTKARSRSDRFQRWLGRRHRLSLKCHRSPGCSACAKASGVHCAKGQGLTWWPRMTEAFCRDVQWDRRSCFSLESRQQVAGAYSAFSIIPDYISSYIQVSQQIPNPQFYPIHYMSHLIIL